MRCCACEDIHVDADGDGAPGSGACVEGYFWDCDDTDPTIYPDAPDTPGDGIDQNCDGVDGTRTSDAWVPRDMGRDLGQDAALSGDAHAG